MVFLELDFQPNNVLKCNTACDFSFTKFYGYFKRQESPGSLSQEESWMLPKECPAYSLNRNLAGLSQFMRH
jgi:hypothetical protein